MNKFIRKKDVFVILIILSFGILGMFFYRNSNKNLNKSSIVAEITVDSDLIMTVPLDNPQIIVLETNPNIKFEVTKEHTIGFIHSNCPDKICIASGFLSNPSEFAACLPNKTMLKIVDTNPSEKSVDTTA